MDVERSKLIVELNDGLMITIEEEMAEEIHSKINDDDDCIFLCISSACGLVYMTICKDRIKYYEYSVVTKKRVYMNGEDGDE